MAAGAGTRRHLEPPCMTRNNAHAA